MDYFGEGKRVTMMKFDLSVSGFRAPVAGCVLMAGFVLCASAQQPTLPYQDWHLPVAQRVDDLVGRMTVDEKVGQLVNDAPAIPRLGIPAYDYWNEGLHGVARAGYATLFPQAIGMAATWDAPLIGRIATAISTEARTKNNDALLHGNHRIYYGLTFWSPNINIFRDPRWGRGQETYGEDPYLTSRLGVAFVEGLQGDDPHYFKTIATPKHFAVHSGPESSRHRFNVDPTPHDLEDTYLPAFRATIVEARADSIMCAYNAVDGKPACASDLLLEQKLRGDWGFQGFVTSDCGAVDDFFEKTAHAYVPDKEHAAVVGLRAGTDTNCGSTYKALGAAIQQGLIQEAELDVSLKRLFTARMKLGLFDPPSAVPYTAIPFSEVGSAEHRALALEAARKAMVLLKNDGGFLPLAHDLKTIAVVGPNAASLTAVIGNYYAIPRDPVLPVDALGAEFTQAKILYEQGSPYAEGVDIVAPRTLFRTAVSSDVEGLSAEYFANADFSGNAVRRVDKQIEFDWNSAAPVPGTSPAAYSVRWTGTIAAPAAGEYKFEVKVGHCSECTDSYTIAIDGKVVSEFHASTGERGRTTPFTVSFRDTKPHGLRIEHSHTSPLVGGGFTLSWTPPVSPLRERAVAAAQQADVVLAFVGLSPDLEGEEKNIHVEGFAGGDRTDIKLPSAQQQMLEAVAATGKPVVVVLLNGSAVAVEWAQTHAKAILEAWYPGQAGSEAISETLSGKNNPGGRLPVTFYADVAQLPAFDDYSMANRTYRYFKGKPLYKFGDGLSYSHFVYSGLKLSASRLAAGATLTVETDVTNAGKVAGDEVAELYLTPPTSSVTPALALEGFQRVHLAAGETRHLTFTLDPRQLSEVDEKGVRAVAPGSYSVSLGGSQPASTGTTGLAFTVIGSVILPR